MTTTSGMASPEGDGINAQEKESVKLQQEECLRPRIPARSIISSRGMFLIKESNQVPKYDGTGGAQEGL
jgi:hypothetical protein